ncbi:hypothetical protein C8F01DRAFT_1086549 [Mycena amicta]|nr:hypothetical protein C8F01DRAFT_1086549 [Mycena amicta]
MSSDHEPRLPPELERGKSIQNAREYLRETEEELKREEVEVRVLREREGLQTAEMVEEQKVYLQMHAVLEDTKAKLVELEQVWKARAVGSISENVDGALVSPNGIRRHT